MSPNVRRFLSAVSEIQYRHRRKGACKISPVITRTRDRAAPTWGTGTIAQLTVGGGVAGKAAFRPSCKYQSRSASQNCRDGGSTCAATPLGTPTRQFATMRPGSSADPSGDFIIAAAARMAREGLTQPGHREKISPSSIHVAGAAEAAHGREKENRGSIARSRKPNAHSRPMRARSARRARACASTTIWSPRHAACARSARRGWASHALACAPAATSCDDRTSGAPGRRVTDGSHHHRQLRLPPEIVGR